MVIISLFGNINDTSSNSKLLRIGVAVLVTLAVCDIRRSLLPSFAEKWTAVSRSPNPSLRKTGYNFSSKIHFKMKKTIGSFEVRSIFLL